jgi:APA family basic amino acid/polyamine antiporter
MTTTPQTKLIRGLSLVDATSIVIGTIIGTGIFLKTATMTQYLGNSSWVIAVWIFAGLLSFTGALSYAELGSMMPKAGGEYVFLSEGYGKFFAFLYGWMRFWIGGPGSIAAYTAGTITFLSTIVDLSFLGGKVFLSIFIISFFTLLNCLSVSFGGKIQSFLTAIKLIMIISLSVSIFAFAPAISQSTSSSLTELTHSFPGWSAIGSALLAALWAYDGWNYLAMVAGEIKNPQKNIPLSLGFGLLAIVVIYLFSNFAYFYALPVQEIMTSNSNAYPQALPVATKAAVTFLGNHGIKILSVAFIISALGAMNGAILTSARVPFAMAQDGLFFKFLGKLSPKTSVPVISILTQGCISIILVLSGTFDQLTDYVVFSAWIFYALVTSVVFVLRRRHPDAERPYKTFGYPVIPFIFIVVALLLLVNTIISNPTGTGIGLSLILAGVPVYYLFNALNKKTNT